MKILNFILLSSCLSLLFTSCKKGEDDPAISLRTRKARLTGDWKLTSGTETNSRVYNGFLRDPQMPGQPIPYRRAGEEKTTFDGTHYVRNFSESFGASTSTDEISGVHAFTLSFKKDGTFEWNRTYDKSTTVIRGIWAFTGRIGETKNKEQIILTESEVTDPSGNNAITSSGNQPFVTFNLKELRNKKMVLIFEENTSNTGIENNNPTTEETTNKWEYIMEQ